MPAMLVAAAAAKTKGFGRTRVDPLNPLPVDRGRREAVEVAMKFGT
jgi:hypothetical protein